MTYKLVVPQETNDVVFFFGACCTGISHSQRKFVTSQAAKARLVVKKKETQASGNSLFIS